MNGKKIEYLEEERRKLWKEVVTQKDVNKGMQSTIDSLQNEIISLKDAVEKKTSDYEQEAKNSSRQASRYKNKTIETFGEAESRKTTIVELAEKAQSMHDALVAIDEKYVNIKTQESQVTKAYSHIVSAKETFLSEEEEIGQTLLEVKELLQSAQSVSENMSELKSEIESVNDKITLFYSQAAKKKKEVDRIHDEIFGYVYEDEDTGEETTEEGLKNELDEAYSELKKDVASFSEDLTEFKDNKIEEYESFQSTKSDEFETIKEKVRGLLPEAMTAGLSSAYETKRKAEEEEQSNASTTFRRSIYALSLISIIPIAVSLYSFFHDEKTLDEIIQNLPRIVLAIAPLYAPVFWFAIAANKRIKLAKRLIEEYAHKESLSKTFEGLSTQIASLEDSEVSRELRVRLLYNIISVSSENPGKLISNYDQSDNPVLDVLDKSVSLSKSLEKMSAIPGMEFILQKVVKQQEEKKDVIESAVKDAVDDEG